ncbi:MAG: DUF4040 domain-containing protein [Melioribacter sp.]|nr:DUF4040 domain-containing protein [Melioribacter sp.]
MPIEIWLIFILCVMIIASIAALEIKDILSSIIAIGVVGLGVSLSFLFLQAPDLAVVQFLFEIFALIILVRAFVKKEFHQHEETKNNLLISIVTIVVLGLLFLLSLPVFQNLPVFGQPLMTVSEYYLFHGALQTGAANLVAAIILDYRAYDTLGEVTVLFTAIIGTLSILKIRSKEKNRETSNE